MNSPPRRLGWSRRGLMYLVVGIQVLFLGAIVASQEVNRLLDSSPAVDLEIPEAHAQKDPFRGASISGQPALNLDGAGVGLPPGKLQPGEKVLVYFALEPGKQPRISMVERRRWGREPVFDATQFSIPGKVRRKDDSSPDSRGGSGLVARVGTPAVSVELNLPTSVPIDEAVMRELPGPSMVRAALRQGFLGHRYLADVRLSGRRWTPDMSFAFDEARDRLVVFAPKQVQWDPRRSGDSDPRSEIFVLDGTGKEVRSIEVAGRLVEGAVNPTDGMVLALLSTEPWGNITLQLVQIGEDGSVSQRGPQILSERIVGFEEGERALWVLAGQPTSSPRAPFFVEQLTIGGFRGPRLGPFTSKPQVTLARGQQVWVLEPEQHRVTRLDRTGRVEQEYRDVNRPTHLAVDQGALVVIEANQTQLSKFSPDGRNLWRVPRFQGLGWILPEAGTGGGWVGAQRFESQEGGVFRFESDGKISRLPAKITPRTTGEWNRGRLAPEAVRAVGQGRIYCRDFQAIVILGGDGAVLKRVEGFRYAQPQRVRQ